MADSVERLLHEEKLQKILLDSTHAAMKTVSNFSDAASLPAPFALFGILDKGAQLAESIVHTCARKVNKTYDQALQRAAKVSGSVLAGAFLESVEREGSASDGSVASLPRIVTLHDFDIAIDTDTAPMLEMSHLL